ncbi:MAG: hypothetical protein AAF529_23280 [Pseudomonadota bacterium]
MKPHIRYTTLTGADDSVHPSDLLKLSERFRRVEFGILFSESRTGQPRYPTAEWVWWLLDHSDQLQLSAHLCGKSLTRYASNADKYWNQVLHGGFKRIQLNMNWQRMDASVRRCISMRIWENPQIQYIVQYNQANHDAFKYFADAPNVAILFDASGGRGTEIGRLPRPIPGYFCGYAGGLSPQNIDQKVRELESVVGPGATWLDMETGVRTKERFDLNKARAVLNAVWRASA